MTSSNGPSAETDGRRTAPVPWDRDDAARPGLDAAQRAVGAAAAGRAAVPVAAARARGRRLGGGRPDGLGHHRLGRRQARPLAGPVQPARRAARPRGRPALHRLHAGRARPPRHRRRCGWSRCSWAARWCSASRCSSCATTATRRCRCTTSARPPPSCCSTPSRACCSPRASGWFATAIASPSPGPSRIWGTALYLLAGAFYVVQVVGHRPRRAGRAAAGAVP